jgi:hypothetical protein
MFVPVLEWEFLFVFRERRLIQRFLPTTVQQPEESRASAAFGSPRKSTRALTRAPLLEY